MGTAASGKIGTAYVDVVGDFGPLHRQIERLRAQNQAKFKQIGDDAARGMQPGLDRVRRSTRATGDDVTGLTKRLQGLERQASPSSRALRNVAGAVTNVKPAVMVAGLGAATQGLASLTAGTFAAASALGPLTGLAAAAGNALAAAAQGAGVFALAAMGIGDALKEQITNQTQAAAGATKSADTQRAAARAIASAQEGVRQAREQVREATMRVGDAERDYKDRLAAVGSAQIRVADAQKQLNAAREEAKRGLQDTRDALVDATSAETRATWALRDARKALQDLVDGPNPDDVAAAHNAAGDAAREAERAELDLAEQRRETAAILDDPTSTEEQKARARLALADAEDRVADAKRATEKAQTALNEAQKPATEQAIAEARQDLLDAESAMEQATRRRTRAQEDLNAAEEAGIRGAANVIQAQRDVRDAQKDLALAQRDVRDAARDVSEARRDVAEAERQVGIAMQGVADAQESAASGATQAAGAAANLNEEFDKLPPAAKAFVQQLVALKPRFDELRATAAAGLFPGASAGLSAAMGNFGALNRVVDVTSKVLGDLLRRFGELLGSKGFGRDFETIGGSNARVIDSLGTAAISLTSALRHVMVAAAPLTEWLARSVEKWAALKDQQAAAGRESGRLGAFFDRTREVLTRVVSIARNFGGALMNIGAAARPLGDDILAALDKSAQGFKAWTESVSGQNQLKDYFAAAKEPVFEIGRLIRDVTKTFFRMGNGEGLAPLIKQIREDLLPIFERVVTSTTHAFGPALVKALGQVMLLIEQIAGSGGPLTLYVKLLGSAAQGLATMLQKVPGLKTLLTTMVAIGVAMKAMSFISAISGLSAITRGAVGAAAAYRGLAAGQTAATVAEQRGAGATLAARVALVAKTAALKGAALAQRAVAAATLIPMYTQLVARLVAARVALVAQKVAMLATAAAARVMAAAQLALNLVMSANPIGLLVAAIAALVAGVVIAYRESETFRAIVDKVWAAVKTAITTAVRGIGDAIDWLKDAAGKAFELIRTAAEYGLLGPVGLIITRWDELVAFITGAFTAVKNAATKTFGAIVDAITGLGSKLIGAGKWVVDTVVGAIKLYISAVTAVGGWITNRIVDGLKAAVSAVSTVGGWLKNRIEDAIHGAVDGLKSIGGWVTNRLVDGIKAATSAITSVGGWLKNRVEETVHDAIDGLKSIGGWVTNRLVDGIKAATETVATVGGWLKNRVVDAVHAAKDGFTDLGGWIIDKIIAGLTGGANLFVGFINKIIGVINKIPGVEIGKVSELRTGGTVGGGPGTDSRMGGVPGYARGGVVHHDGWFSKGGEITRPMVIVGEEAPAFKEFVIPTNPAYRSRALGLHAQLGRELGVPGFAVGGVLGDTIGDLAGAAFDLAKGGAGSFTKLLPNTDGLGWLKGTGSYVLGKVTDWIKKKVSGLIPGKGEGFSGGEFGKVQRLAAMIKKMDAIDAKGYPYSYGGGHNGSFSPSRDIRPGRDGFGYDCSGLVSAILNAGGLLSSVQSTDGLKVYGEGGDGKALTIGVRGSSGLQAHTMMRIGGRYLESGSGHGAKWVNGWSGNFPIHRHPKGFAEGGILDKLLAGDDDALGYGLARGGVFPDPFVGSYRDGGTVPADGFAYVHKDERVTPADQIPQVLVFVGDKEITDIVRVEVRETKRATAQMGRAGRVLP